MGAIEKLDGLMLIASRLARPVLGACNFRHNLQHIVGQRV